MHPSRTEHLENMSTAELSRRRLKLNVSNPQDDDNDDDDEKEHEEEDEQ